MHLTIRPKRRDNKYPSRLAYEGEPNMFGGRYPPKVFNKLYTRERLEELISNAVSDSIVVNTSGESFPEVPTGSDS